MEDMHAFFRSRRLLLAPMAGVSDEAFRTLCREQGADLTYTEMVSAKGLSYANEKTRHLLRLAPGEDQVAVQLFGHEPDTMAAQAAWIEREMGQSLAYLDINMGCPASSQPAASAASSTSAAICGRRMSQPSFFTVQRMNSSTKGTVRLKVTSETNTTRFALSVTSASSSESVSIQMPASSISPINTRV